MPKELILIIRSIQAGRFYSLVSIVGLAIAITAVILVGTLTRHELAYDHQYSAADRIYRLNWVNNGTGDRFATMFNPFSPPLATNTAEIEAAARIGTFEVMLRRDVAIGTPGVADIELTGFVDPAFLEIFDFDLVAGDLDAALRSRNAIVVTRAGAEKYFPGEAALGQTLMLEDGLPMTVTAVIDDMPASTHFPFNFLVPLDVARDIFDGAGWLDSWGSDSVYHYLKVRDGVTQAQLQTRIDDFLSRQAPYEEWDISVLTQRLTDIHFMPDLQNEMPLRDPLRDIVKSPRQMSDLGLFLAGAAVLVLIASFNFMNLQIARGVGRSRQLGLLKAIGASKLDLFRRLMFESLLMAGLALVVAAPLVELTLGAFSNVLAVHLDWSEVMRPTVIGSVLALTVGLGIVSGAYPAWIMASQPPGLVLKGEFSWGQGVHRIRNVLVLLQFAVSVVLIAVSLVIYKQIGYSISAPLGFDAEHAAVIDIGRREADGDYGTLRARLLEHADVVDVSRGTIIPTGNLSDGTTLYPQESGPDAEIAMRSVQADFRYFESLGMTMAAGRGFDEGNPADEFRFPSAENPVSRGGIVINEATARRAGWTDAEAAIGKILQTSYNWQGTDMSVLLEVVGVVEDVHFRSLRSPVVPMIFYMAQRGDILIVRVAERTDDLVGYIESVWAETVPEIRLQIDWLGESVAGLYEQETRTLRLLSGVAIVAIGVACLGLFAVAQLVMELRRREVALRKVFGATMLDIVNLLSWRFIKFIALANVIALPVAWFYLSDWLTTFVYRIELEAVYLLAPAFATLLIAWLTVAAQAWVVARRHPISALRYE